MDGTQPLPIPNLKPLETMRERFCQEYLVDLNATQAAIRAGYSEKTARVQGPRLLLNDAIQRRVAELNRKRVEKVELNAEMVLKETMKIAFTSIKRVFDRDGKLLPVCMFPDDIGSSISSIEVTSRQTSSVEPIEIEYTRKIKFWNKLHALELLGKHLQLFGQKMGPNTESVNPAEPVEDTPEEKQARLERIKKYALALKKLDPETYGF